MDAKYKSTSGNSSCGDEDEYAIKLAHSVLRTPLSSISAQVLARALLNRLDGPKSESLVSAWNESVQRGLKHEFFQDGLAADTYELQPWQAYAEGWRDAWLDSADDLRNATQDHP